MVQEGKVALVQEGKVALVQEGKVALVQEGKVALVQEAKVAVRPVLDSSPGTSIISCIVHFSPTGIEACHR